METSVSTKDLVSDYRNFYNNNKETLLSAAPSFMKNIREEGIAEFGKLGMPGKNRNAINTHFWNHFFQKNITRKLLQINFHLNLKTYSNAMSQKLAPMLSLS